MPVLPNSDRSISRACAGPAQALAARSQVDYPVVRGRAKVWLTVVDEFIPPAQPSLASRVFSSLKRLLPAGFGDAGRAFRCKSD